MLKPALTMVVIATNTVLLTTPCANAYQFFNNRDSWNNAVQGKQIVTEDFKNNGFVTEDTVFNSGFKYADSGFLGGARVSDNSFNTFARFRSHNVASTLLELRLFRIREISAIISRLVKNSVPLFHTGFLDSKPWCIRTLRSAYSRQIQYFV